MILEAPGTQCELQDQNRNLLATIRKLQPGDASWTNVAVNLGTSPGEARYVRLAMQNGMPCVAFRDEGAAGKILVMCFDRAPPSYYHTSVGTADSLATVAVTDVNNLFHITYYDPLEFAGITVKKRDPTLFFMDTILPGCCETTPQPLPRYLSMAVRMSSGVPSQLLVGWC